MLSDAGQQRRGEHQAGSAFWWRFADNAFRRLWWFVLPIVAFGLIGFAQARNAQQLYQSSGVLSASSNPLVPSQPGSTSNLWESPANAATRIMNEQLRTDAFIVDVAERAGLGEYATSDPFAVQIIRESVWASASGTSLVTVNSEWADPQTSFELVTATIENYQEYVAETVALNSSEAVTFYNDQLTDWQQREATAEDDLVTFVDGLPELREGETRPLATVIQLDKLTGEFESAAERVSEIEAQIEIAELAVATSRSEAGRIMTVIDPPQLPTAPESTIVGRILTVASFGMLGVILAIGALLATTALDRTVASPADLLALDGVPLVATVPTLRFADANPARRSLGRGWRGRERGRERGRLRGRSRKAAG